MRQVLSANLKALMSSHPDYRENDNKPKALAKAADISLSSVQRVMNAEVGASLDTLEQIAAVFDIAVYQLLLPNLDPANPQIVSGASAAERKWYRSLKNTAVQNNA